MSEQGRARRSSRVAGGYEGEGEDEVSVRCKTYTNVVLWRLNGSYQSDMLNSGGQEVLVGAKPTTRFLVEALVKLSCEDEESAQGKTILGTTERVNDRLEYLLKQTATGATLEIFRRQTPKLLKLDGLLTCLLWP